MSTIVVVCEQPCIIMLRVRTSDSSHSCVDGGGGVRNRADASWSGWLCRLVVQALPLMLVVGVGAVLLSVRAVQWTKSHVFRVLPFGALTNFDAMDACTGILVSGLFMIYFGRMDLRVADVVGRLAQLLVKRPSPSPSYCLNLLLKIHWNDCY